MCVLLRGYNLRVKQMSGNQSPSGTESHGCKRQYLPKGRASGPACSAPQGSDNPTIRIMFAGAPPQPCRSHFSGVVRSACPAQQGTCLDIYCISRECNLLSLINTFFWLLQLLQSRVCALRPKRGLQPSPGPRASPGCLEPSRRAGDPSSLSPCPRPEPRGPVLSSSQHRLGVPYLPVFPGDTRQPRQGLTLFSIQIFFFFCVCVCV